MQERECPNPIVDHIEDEIVALISRMDIKDPSIRNYDEERAASLLREIMSKERYKMFKKDKGGEKLLKSYIVSLIIIFRARHSDFYDEIGFNVDKDDVSSLLFGLFEKECATP